MLRLTLSNIRCFSKSYELPIAPLTIITGENSAGKSTLLACLSVLFDPEGFPFQPSFNRPPYSLGSYDTIACFKGGKYGRAKQFSLGYKLDEAFKFAPTAVEATYNFQEGNVGISHLLITRNDQQFELSIKKDEGDIWRGHVRYRKDADSKDTVHPFATRRLPGDARPHSLSDLFLMFTLPSESDQRRKEGRAVSDEYAQILRELPHLVRYLSPGRSVSIAPIRTRPERVYATPTELYDPSGNHVPFMLDKLFRNPSSREAKTVLDAITRFGDESGMFSRVRLRKLGSKVGDPFQLMVTIGGKERNLIDVGYGVSQALPIIIQTALSNTRDTVLIQQPEVHLHPRAQAALGDFFTRLIRVGRRRLIIETHSDYIIDRVRSVVAKGLPCDNVKIIFLERRRMESLPHVIDLDGQGNIKNAPSSYRNFFLEEQRRVLTRGA